MKYTKKNKYLKKRTPKTADYKIRNTVFVFTDSNFLNLIGKTKEEIVLLVGDQFNDIHSDIWMYRNYDKKRLFEKKYLYLKFENNKVKQFEYKVFSNPYTNFV
tara:strand:+ start:2440 stop:2748 length:309 start_codon:yes stop_codon:yes gene_type:complete